MNWPCQIHNGLDTTRNYPNIARYRPILPQYRPILPDIARYRVISPHIAQNMGPFNVTITVMVRRKKFCHLTITVMGWILGRILSRCCHEVVTEHIEHNCHTCIKNLCMIFTESAPRHHLFPFSNQVVCQALPSTHNYPQVAQASLKYPQVHLSTTTYTDCPQSIPKYLNTPKYPKVL